MTCKNYLGYIASGHQTTTVYMPSATDAGGVEQPVRANQNEEQPTPFRFMTFCGWYYFGLVSSYSVYSHVIVALSGNEPCEAVRRKWPSWRRRDRTGLCFLKKSLGVAALRITISCPPLSTNLATICDPQKLPTTVQDSIHGMKIKENEDVCLHSIHSIPT